ncbi:hypothetical protein LQW54_006729 [Pestalotiopsis sp. IQ-011]
MFKIVFFIVTLAAYGLGRPTTAAAHAINSRQSFNARMAWYDEEGGLGVNAGACGETNHRNQKIVALNHFQFVELGNSANPNQADVCHKKIQITNQGKETEAEITDSCDACNYGDIDGTQAVFNDLVGGLGAGNVSVSWSFV